jgi:hypothetical protein
MIPESFGAGRSNERPASCSSAHQFVDTLLAGVMTEPARWYKSYPIPSPGAEA